jgi:hypothetical protein
MDVLEHIRAQIRANNYSFSLHAEREREDEHILVQPLPPKWVDPWTRRR